MVIADVFTIKGRGSVITGRVHSGAVRVGDEVFFKQQSGVLKIAVKGLESNRAQITEAMAGDNIGLLTDDLPKGALKRGDVLSGSDTDWSLGP
jgi:elongation factor Tu